VEACSSETSNDSTDHVALHHKIELVITTAVRTSNHTTRMFDPRLRWTVHVARMSAKINYYRVLIRKREVTSPHASYVHDSTGNI
jgi:hypothetical protein